MYSHLRRKGQSVTKQPIRQAPRSRKVSYVAVRGRDMRMLSILEPGVARPNFTPLSYTRLNSTYLQQMHKISTFIRFTEH